MEMSRWISRFIRLQRLGSNTSRVMPERSSPEQVSRGPCKLDMTYAKFLSLLLELFFFILPFSSIISLSLVGDVWLDLYIPNAGSKQKTLLANLIFSSLGLTQSCLPGSVAANILESTSCSSNLLLLSRRRSCCCSCCCF